MKPLFRRPIRRPAFLDRSPRRRHRPDYWLLLLTLALLTIGLIVIYAISPSLSIQRNVSENYFVSKQLLAIGLGLVSFLVFARTKPAVWRRWQWPLIILAGAAALTVRVFGEEVNGAYRWLQFGGMSFQAVELIKFALLIWCAGFLADRLQGQTLANYRQTFKPLLIALGLVSVVVAILQSDLGSTVVLVAMMGAMAFIAGLPLRRVVLIGGVVVIGLVVVALGSSYRRDRLTTFLQPEQHCQTSGYQLCQALIAVGSGGLFGLGLARSVQATGYLPQAADDSIFAIFAEKFGFVGVVVLLLLFLGLFVRIKQVIERAPDNFSRLIATGVLAWLSTQALINVGAMIGLLPLKGITLPFISYGGTSLLFVTGAVGLVFQISRYTSFVQTAQKREGTDDDNRSDRRRLRGAYHPDPGGRLSA